MSLLAGARQPPTPLSQIPSLPPPPSSSSLSSPPASVRAQHPYPLSPPLPSAGTSRASSTASPSPTPRLFDSELLRPHVKAACVRLSNSSWGRDSGRVKGWCRDIGEEVKSKMLELEPNGYKFFVSVSISERGQGSQGHLSAFWDSATDASLSETFTNDSIVCSVLAVAMRYG